LGAGAGNAQLECSSVLDKIGVQTGVDLYKVMDAAENVLAPCCHGPIVINNDSFMLAMRGLLGFLLMRAGRNASTSYS